MPVDPTELAENASPDQLEAAYNAAVADYHEGRLDDAERILERIDGVSPDNPQVLHMRALVGLDGDRPEDAAKWAARAIRIQSDQPDLHMILGDALVRAGKPEEAKPALDRALALAPGHVAARFLLAKLLHDKGATGEAIAEYRRIIDAEPDFADAHYNLGLALKASEHLEEAESAYRRALAIAPDDAETHNNLGNLLHLLDRREEAVPHFRTAIANAPESLEAYYNFCRVLLEIGEPDEVLSLARTANEIKPGDTHALVYLAVGHMVQGNRDELTALLDFDRFIMTRECEPPPGFGSIQDFNAALAGHLADHPDLTYEPKGKATRYGAQVNDLRVGPKGPITAFERLLDDAFEDYRARLGADDRHPFVNAVPQSYDLSIFGTILMKQGHQSPHIHPAGWLSGVYYVELPAEISGSDGTAGWIEFGRPWDDLGIAVEPETRLIQPREGCMYLFPSYFLHNTVALEHEARRISIAFDFVPKA